MSVVDTIKYISFLLIGIKITNLIHQYVKVVPLMIFFFTKYNIVFFINCLFFFLFDIIMIVVNVCKEYKSK